MEVNVEKTVSQLFTLSTKQHLFLIEYKGLSLKQRLTATKWGATQDCLPTVCKTYVRSVLDNGCEVVTLPSKTNLEKYDVVQNSDLRIITGGAKSTPTVAMQLQTAIKPHDSRRDKFTLKFWERARRADCKYCKEYRCATQRLKTDFSFTCETSYEETPTSTINDSSCSYTVLLHSRGQSCV
ncbi:uncharacterized protein TNCV_3167441 [Trichonephila clavipes]|uniref:Uncharacterized protein n=1 Tax=Trichonephila clavipes TaxID=2585209 RepID=A0A8X6UWY7_TRICX|nr:uncharacterized protein TNCV_3167441 [Trichonephila clavipes]